MSESVTSSSSSISLEELKSLVCQSFIRFEGQEPRALHRLTLFDSKEKRRTNQSQWVAYLYQCLQTDRFQAYLGIIPSPKKRIKSSSLLLQHSYSSNAHEHKSMDDNQMCDEVDEKYKDVEGIDQSSVSTLTPMDDIDLHTPETGSLNPNRMSTSNIQPSPPANSSLSNIQYEWTRRCCNDKKQDCLNMKMPQHVQQYAEGLTHAFFSDARRKQARRCDGDEKTKGILCQGCYCTLYDFDETLPPHKQHLQTFQIIWQDPEKCHIPRNILKITCRACALLWELCNRDAYTFRFSLETYFRRAGLEVVRAEEAMRQDKPLKDVDRPLYTDNIMEADHVSIPQSQREIASLSLIKGAWMIQCGLVSYPLIPDVMARRDMEDAYQWIQARPVSYRKSEQPMSTNTGSITQDVDMLSTSLLTSLYTENTLLIDENPLDDHGDEDEEDTSGTEKKTLESEFYYKNDQGQRIGKCTRQQLKNLPLQTRKMWPEYYVRRPYEYLTLWTPMNWSTRGHQSTSLMLVPRDPRQRLSSNNFLLTTKFLAWTEQRFGREQMLAWLPRVGYVQGRMPEPFMTFVWYASRRVVRDFPSQHKIKKSEEDTKKQILQDQGQESKPPVIQMIDPIQWKQVEDMCEIPSELSGQSYQALHEYVDTLNQCDALDRGHLIPLKQQFKRREADLIDLENEVNRLKQEVLKVVPMFTQTLQGRDFLEELGLKYTESHHKEPVGTFEHLSASDRARVLKELLIRQHPDYKFTADEITKMNESLLVLAREMENEESLLSVHQPELLHRAHLYPLGRHIRKKQTQLDEEESMTSQIARLRISQYASTWHRSTNTDSVNSNQQLNPHQNQHQENEEFKNE
ncbi:MAG: hypothetical protein Sylvanvirus4_34 [Sylvanvirus sp.]|uniref:Uncharacterized protein n=1 Tax=Sylvanvirus sp. TaxID=2487774 RepID=A0A3G5AHI3_9VIRU|nr:MAG: hypothetical protein Sylvanvirus4_34 [Sylvanvirus sp.]